MVTDLNISTSNSTATAIISWDRPANFLNGINIGYQIEVATCSYTYIANYSNTTLHHIPHRNVSHSVKVKAVTNAGNGEVKTHAVNLPNFVIHLVTTSEGMYMYCIAFSAWNDARHMHACMVSVKAML